MTCILFSSTPRPALIHSTGAMKCLLDAMLVLTKQDRLCHVIHATSEPFYQTWLRRANVMQHCKVRLLFCPWHFILTFGSRSSPLVIVRNLKCGGFSVTESSLMFPRNCALDWFSIIYSRRLEASWHIGRTMLQIMVSALMLLYRN